MKRWFKYAKPYLSSFLLGPFGMIIEVIGEMFMPFLLAQIINSGEAGTLTVGKSIGISAILTGIVLFMMLGGVCGLRLFWIFVIFPLPAFHSLFGLFLCYPLSWGVTDIILGALSFYFFRKKAPLSADREIAVTK